MAYYATNGVARAVSGRYIGVSGVARTVSNMYIGVSGVARRISTAYVGIENTFRVPTATNLYYTVQKIDPEPRDNNVQTVTLGTGAVTVYECARTNKTDDGVRAYTRAYLYGLVAGDTFSFDWNYTGPDEYYQDCVISFADTVYRRGKNDGSGTATHTVTAEEAGKYILFEVSNESGALYRQTLTITNLVVNGQPVICEEVTI